MSIKNPTIIIKPASVSIVSWANGTAAQIQAMLDAHDAGKIDITDYWSLGDTRTISHSAMSAIYVHETHAAQTAEWVLMDTGTASRYVFADNTPVHYVVGMKDCFNETGYMNSSNTSSGMWDQCLRRSWCNNELRDSFPADEKALFKQFKTVTAETYNGSSLKTSIDYFALFAEKEIYGERKMSNVTEADALTQNEYYKTATNRIKNVNGAANIWWTRSSNTGSGFIYVSSQGNPSNTGASVNYGLSPFGCI